jgi:hypothetical protein
VKMLLVAYVSGFIARQLFVMAAVMLARPIWYLKHCHQPVYRGFKKCNSRVNSLSHSTEK